jgi:hypothetical protein
VRATHHHALDHGLPTIGQVLTPWGGFPLVRHVQFLTRLGEVYRIHSDRPYRYPEIFNDIFQQAVADNQIKLIIVDLKTESIVQWKRIAAP